MCDVSICKHTMSSLASAGLKREYETFSGDDLGVHVVRVWYYSRSNLYVCYLSLVLFCFYPVVLMCVYAFARPSATKRNHNIEINKDKCNASAVE